jgi:GNAT superfamily N-acetyltransferase
MIEQTNDLLVRYANDGDINMITNNWLESFRDGYFNSTVSNRVYYNQHHKILEALLPRCMVLVACHPEEPRIGLGWMACEAMDRHLVIHYVYVRKRARQMGVANELLQFVIGSDELDLVRNRVITTHQTHKSKIITRGVRETGYQDYAARHPEQPIEFLYNPYALFWSLPEGWEND